MQVERIRSAHATPRGAKLHVDQVRKGRRISAGAGASVAIAARRRGSDAGMAQDGFR